MTNSSQSTNCTANCYSVSDLFPDSDNDLVDGVQYLVTPEADITPDAIRKIYESEE